jgi:hypothetical protein
LNIDWSFKSDDCNIQLLEAGGSTKPYATLSYCWGNYRPLCTTQENYALHVQGISFKSLPKLFQDAVTTAVHLGLKRLWIDSLCIIQDDKRDWEEQCNKMADIYANARVGIAACDVQDASEGFLQDYSSKLTCNLGGSVSIKCFPDFTVDTDLYYEGSRLSTRGWAIQESLLSGRKIAFKDNRMHWHCTEMQRADDLRFPYAPGRQRQLLGNLFLRQTGNKSLVADYRDWYKIITKYSKASLTKSSDKLPGISGLASLFNRGHESRDTYVAGLWLNDIWNGLAWRCFHRGNTSRTFSYRAPSWSWASIDCEVSFIGSVVSQDLEIVEHNVQRNSADPFGEVTFCSLDVRGALKGIPIQYFDARNRHQSFGYMVFDEDPSERYDCPSDNQVRPLMILLIGYGPFSVPDQGDRRSEIVTRYNRREDIPRDNYAQEMFWRRNWFGLIVEKSSARCDHREQYQRVGLLEGLDCQGAELFDRCARVKLTLI